MSELTLENVKAAIDRKQRGVATEENDALIRASCELVADRLYAGLERVPKGFVYEDN